MNKADYYKDLYAKAVEIASKAHEGQKRWGGEPYITHPLAVAAAFPLTSDAKIVAVLHDVMEDSDVTYRELAAIFPIKIVDALQAMTHTDGQSYADYIMAIRNDPLARQVKLADIRHNLGDLTDPNNPKKHKQRRDKYELAIKLLELP